MLAWIRMGLKVVPLVMSAIGAIEKVAEKKGQAKQDAAVGLVSELLPAIESAISRDVVDDAKVQTGLRAVIDAVVALLNVIEDVKVKRLEASDGAV